MNELVAPVTNITFSLEEALMAQMGALPVPFPGMDKVWIRKLWVQIDSVNFGYKFLSFILKYLGILFWFSSKLNSSFGCFYATWQVDIAEPIE